MVTPEGRHKRRMVVDYSQNINEFTLLDAYPLPRIEDIVNDIAKYSVFSTLDLKSVYYQIPISDEYKCYTAFEANGKLYQFCRMPFGLTNTVASFQHIIDDLIVSYSLTDTFPYLDDVTIGGRAQQEHGQNVRRFLEMVTEQGLTLNESKSIIAVSSINLLDYTVFHFIFFSFINT